MDRRRALCRAVDRAALEPGYPPLEKLDLNRLNPAHTATEVFDASGGSMGALQGGKAQWWISLDQVAESARDAFISAEDLRFYRHHGVDIYRMFGALWNDLRTRSLSQGGSTITQQLIKLTHLSSAKSLSRKAQEIVLALQLERVMDKRQILEAYLNTVYFGHGAYGIEAAANTYFGKHASALTLAEGALLAGIIKAPSTYAPHLNPEKAVARRNSILSIMAENGFITEAQAGHARAEALQLHDDSEEQLSAAWYTDAVLTEAQEVLKLSADDVLSGGYAIDTGFDPHMQAAADALFTDAGRFPADALDGAQVQASLIALDTATGEARCVVGGRRYDVAMGLNRATQIRRQPGSAFKPVSTYAAAVDAYGFVPTSTVEDTPRSFDGGYTPRNAGGNTYGTVTLREALSRSLNIATVDLADLIGVEALRAYAARFGLPLSVRDVNLSLALGALTDGVSPSEMCAAYSALANGGRRVRAHFIRAIRDRDGWTVYRAEGALDRAVQDSTAYLLTDMLKTAARSGSARALSDATVPVAGKTGTVSEPDGGTRDIWTLAYTPELSVAVWMGFDQPGGERVMSASEGGSGCPARMCAAFLRDVADRLSGVDFKRPASVRTALIDAIALEETHQALLIDERTPAEYTVEELFRADSLPARYSDNWAAPHAVDDFRLLTSPGETPVLAFTARDASSEYLLVRDCDGKTVQLTTLRGEPGESLRYADTDHDLSRSADYALIPRNALLYAAGALLTGPRSATVHYAPGGLLNRLFDGDAAPSEAPGASVEVDDAHSLFE